MADIDSSLRQWSSTASSNKPTGATSIGSGLDDNLRAIQAVVRQYLASPGSTIVSASTVDLSTADGRSIPISGSATVSGLGTEVSGLEYLLTTTGTQVWKNSSALLLPGAADITLVSGDCLLAKSNGSGNWVIPFLQKLSGQPVIAGSAGGGISIVGAVTSLDINKLTATTVPLSTYAVPVFSADTSTVLKSTLANLLTKPTRQVFTSGSGTYVTPAGVARINVRLIGGGGGGGGATANNGATGTNTTFSTFTASGGVGGAAAGGSGGAGGAASGGTVNIPGGAGQGAGTSATAGVFMPGGQGGSSFLGGAGPGGAGNNSPSIAAATNSGGGGGGAGGVGGSSAGAGGGSGGYVDAFITAPSASYAYTVGPGGTGGSAGGIAGGNGAAGIIIVEEFYG